MIGPGESCDFAVGRMPVRLTRPTVGLSATTPALPAGAIICAVSVDVSVPTVIAARPVEVAAAAPADEPGHGFHVSIGRSTWPPSDE
ncbi:unannotated protein [freshwater metagenome]|uniref:Unannotated protein n=1 Tax=freshwater metagenome TaxID=449393 RepID=A0A6J7L6J4_9ZZZZ